MPANKETLFGRIAVLLGFVTEEDIVEAVGIQEGEPGRPLGAILVSEDKLTDDQLAHILEVQTRNMQEAPSYSSQKKEDILFGKIVVKKNYASSEAVNWALREQALLHREGAYFKLGELLIYKGYLSPEQIQNILTEQGKQILLCTKCLKQYNVSKYKPGGYVKCKLCGEVLQIPEQVVTASVDGEIQEEKVSGQPDVQEQEVVNIPDAPASGSRVSSISEGMYLGKYKIEDKLGEGGMGTVFKAYDPELKRSIALKVMSKGELATDNDKKRFLREARTSANLTHPNIVRTFDVGVEDDIHFMVMEYIDGPNLLKYVKEYNPTRREILHIMEKVSKGVHYAHTHKVIHRDLKPHNVMITMEGEPKVTDFGLAKKVPAKGHESVSLMTQEGVVLGTPEYMSPEQADGRIKEINEQSDVYSLGVILYHLFTGRLPFTGSTPLQVCRKIFFEKAVSPSQFSKRVTPQLETVIMKCMEKEKNKRYKSAKQLSLELNRLYKGEKIEAGKGGALHDLGEAAGKSKSTLVIAGYIALLLIALVLYGLYSSKSSSEQKLQEEVLNLKKQAASRMREVPSGTASETEVARMELELQDKQNEINKLNRELQQLKDNATKSNQTEIELFKKELEDKKELIKQLKTAVEKNDAEKAKQLLNAFSKKSNPDSEIDSNKDPFIWIKRTPAISPHARVNPAMVYDSSRKRVVLFGGIYNDGEKNLRLNDTWEWDGKNWVKKYPLKSPPAATGIGMAYDSKRKKTVLFCGTTNPETWEWDGNVWLETITESKPSTRYGYSMAYDSSRGVVVLYGGVIGHRVGGEMKSTFYKDTWEYDGQKWIEKNPSIHPNISVAHAMVYDSLRKRTLLVGAVKSNETWEWDGINWGKIVVPDNAPKARQHAMAFDSSRNVTILYGSRNTWEWNGNKWNIIKLDPSPPVGQNHAMAYDSTRRIIVLFGGGWESSPSSETWEYGIESEKESSNSGQSKGDKEEDNGVIKFSDWPNEVYAKFPLSTSEAESCQKAIAKHLDTHEKMKVHLGNQVYMSFVLIPPGEFMMGSPETEKYHENDEKLHKVKITKPFYMQITEVTQEQWQSVMGNNPSHFKRDNLPVESVSWSDAQVFLKKLSLKYNDKEVTFRLPTEAEWEYACRAGSTTRFCFGDDGIKLSDYAWYSANSGNTTHGVGTKKPNAWALYDMHGNVWEWCQDWYNENYYVSSPSKNPKGPSSGTYRVIRSGAWFDRLESGHHRSADHACEDPSDRGNGNGFRVVCEIHPTRTEDKEPINKKTDIKESNMPLAQINEIIANKEFEKAANQLHKVLDTSSENTTAEKMLGDLLPLIASKKYKLRFDREAREKAGCSKGCQTAIDYALKWLSKHQDNDGKWDMDGFEKHCKSFACGGKGAVDYFDIGLTGLALLAFLADGNTDKTGEYKETVKRGIEYLLKSQTEDGQIGDRKGDSWIYNHAIATMALCELYGMTKNPTLAEPARKAVKYILDAQNPGLGWKYEPKGGKNDTSVTGWMVCALYSAKLAGISVPDAAFKGALKWFYRATRVSDGKCGYERPGDNGSVYKDYDKKFKRLSAMTAVAGYCRVLCGQSNREKRVREAVDILEKNMPQWDKPDGKYVNMYYWYYGAYAMQQYSGYRCDKWLKEMKNALLKNQRTEGCANGSWDPVGLWGVIGGRVYSTAICCLTLEVYYRYLDK